jgi:non-ribosomal peptide synthase protein (TIGR01720 family)
MLKREDHVQPAKALKAIKAQLKGIPNNGIGYELLSYDADNKPVIDSLSHIPWPDILFNYLGRQATNTKLKLAYEYPGPVHDPRDRRSYLIDCSVVIWEGTLTTNWRYSRNLYKNTTIKQLAESYIQWLRALIAGYTTGR